MTTFRVVPEVLRSRKPESRGRIPYSPLSRALLAGQTVFVSGPRKTFGSLYTLAKNNNKQARTHFTHINQEEGTLVWFEEKSTE